MLRWFWKNLSSLALALILGVVVWVAAILNDDPTETQELESQVAIEYSDLRQGLRVVGEAPPEAGTVSLRAPHSAWSQITPDLVHLRVELGGLEEGIHTLAVEPSVELRTARVDSYEPRSVTLTLEREATASVVVRVSLIGEPQLGYRTASTSASPDHAIILGPLSLVDRVEEIRASVNVEDALQDFEQQVALDPLDGEGNVIEGLDLDPALVQVNVHIEPRERFRLVSVIPKLEGEDQLVDAGYQINDVTVDPSVVTVFSADPDALEALPGFVETLPLDVSGADADVERRLALDLPQEISLVEEQSVLVQVSVSPIVRTITIIRDVETRNLAPELFAQLSPESVNIILSGPLPTLNAMATEDVSVIVDLLDLEPGTHQIPPTVIIAPTDVEHESIFPTLIEVIISTSPPPTPTSSP